MNSLKGFGVLALLAGIAFVVSQVAKVDQIVLAVTVGIIAASTVTYVVSRKRYRSDHRVAVGPDATVLLPVLKDPRGASASQPRTPARRRGRAAVALLLVTAFGAAGSLYGWWHLTPQKGVLSAALASPITVRYRTDTPTTASVGKPWLEVINTSAIPVVLRDVKLRYYFDAGDASAYGSNCFQTALRCLNITQTIGVLTKATHRADRFLEVGFTPNAGVLAPGQTSQGIGLQLYRLDHKELNQANDRSFDARVTHYAPSKLVTAYVDGVLSWGEEPSPEVSAPPRTPHGAPVPTTTALPPGVVFDNFRYCGPYDPALTANGWQARTEGGGPGIKSTWSADAISFPADVSAKGGQALQLKVRSDGTRPGTRQAELMSIDDTFSSGTLAARVFFTDRPVSGRNGDHINQSMYTISPSRSSPNYSELDYEYQPNGGWGAPGPKLDTTSWRSAKEGDRATRAHLESLAGWHIVMLTAVNGVVTYSIDGREIFSSGGRTFPRERMRIEFSAWLVDLPFVGAREWDMRVNWLYYVPNRAVALTEVQNAVDSLYARGINYTK